MTSKEDAFRASHLYDGDHAETCFNAGWAAANAQINERDMFEAGFMASWSEMYVKSDGNPAFELNDKALDRAWTIYLATREDAAATPPSEGE